MSRVSIGHQNGDRVFLDSQVRSTHLHVVGGTGVGKSFFLEHMVRRDIRNGHGVCFIDPHGETYDRLVDWLGRYDSAMRPTVHLLNPSDPNWSVGFNPLCSGEGVEAVRQHAMFTAFKKVWFGEEAITPRLDKCLQLVLYTLAHHRLSLMEASLLTSLTEEPIRRKLTEALPVGEWRRTWDEFNNAFKPQQFTDYFESTTSRLLPFVTANPVRRMMGQTENVLDLKSCMDRGEVVLVNLATKGEMTEQSAQILGALIFSELLLSARRRDVAIAGRRPFYCYVDECADYLTSDIARILDQTRKYGLHLTLAHQRLQQLREAGDAVYNGVMESAKSKVVFQVDDDESADILGRHLFRKQFDLELRKEGLTNATAVGQEIITLQSRSRTSSESVIESTSSGEVDSNSTGESSGESQFLPDIGDASGVSVLSGVSFANGSSSVSMTGKAYATTSAETHGEGETLKTIYEERGVPLTLDEQIHLAIKEVRSLPPRSAFLYTTGSTSLAQFETLDVPKKTLLPSWRKDFISKTYERDACASPNATVLSQIEKRAKLLSEGGGNGPVDEDENYWDD